jgi:hypothetical protein
LGLKVEDLDVSAEAEEIDLVDSLEDKEKKKLAEVIDRVF